jgi:hypothetical protein
MNHNRKPLTSLFLPLAVMALIAGPATAQSIGIRIQPAPQPWVRPIVPPVVVQPVQPVQPVPVVVPTQQCPTGDCVPLAITTQDRCQMFDRQATGDARWHQGLSTSIDSELFVEQQQRGWDVSAYRIRWSNGAWSEWYVPGVNDIDHKYNPGPNTMRRMWSYFTDHEHQALACHRAQ